MARVRTPFERSSAKFKEQASILVICEDSKSGKKYLEDAAQHFRIRVRVEIVFCGHTDPLGIVREAIRRERHFDKVYCVIDRDDHPSFEAAISLSRSATKVEMITSFPCFEYWYLLHFGNSRKSYKSAGGKSAGERLLSDLRKIGNLKDYAKGSADSIFAGLLDRLPAARKNSETVLSQAMEDGNFNPSSVVHKLIADFEEMSVPQPVVKP